MASAQQEQTTFDVTQARDIVRGFFAHRPAIYWTDMLVTMTIGYAAAGAYLTIGVPLWIRIAGFFVGGIALYRLSSMMHEIVHFKKDQMNGFKITWNVLAGIPMLIPTLFYESHIAHHNTHYYGTGRDGEYLPLGNGTWKNVWLFLLQVFLQPIFVIFRFLILTPLSLLLPGVRRWTLEHASSFVINLRYKRVFDKPPHVVWTWMEIGCCLRSALIFAQVMILPALWPKIFLLYGLAVFILALNYVRTLSAHFYLSRGKTMSHQQQFFDSTNIEGNFLTEALCPIGLRYHALHHLFPALPYHNLGAAHRQLMKELPETSDYRSILFPSFLSVIRELNRNVRLAAESPQSFQQWRAVGEPAAARERQHTGPDIKEAGNAWATFRRSISQRHNGAKSRGENRSRSRR